MKRITSLKSILGLALLVAMPCIAAGQSRSLLNTQLPAGEIGATQVRRKPHLAHVWQPTLVRVPDGATVWFAEGAGFSAGRANAELVSLEVGSTYRLKVSNIPNNYGDVYPTVELIDRLHAPPGKETRYPVPIEITTEELEMALSGKFVTRVIYVENPRNAIGARELPEQRYFDALPSEDPYEVASRIGRPIAILRMGSVTPNLMGNTSEFLFGVPPIQRHALWPKQPEYKPSELKPSDLPADPEKRDPLPEAPEQPDAEDDVLAVPDDLPGKVDVEEQPTTTLEDEEAVDELAPSDTTLEPTDDFDFGDDSPSDAGDDDPFSDFE